MVLTGGIIFLYQIIIFMEVQAPEVESFLDFLSNSRLYVDVPRLVIVPATELKITTKMRIISILWLGLN